jgi:hypothetical protein
VEKVYPVSTEWSGFWIADKLLRKEVTFDSGKLPQPFLNPVVMEQRRKQHAEREKKDQG